MAEYKLSASLSGHEDDVSLLLLTLLPQLQIPAGDVSFGLTGLSS